MGGMKVLWVVAALACGGCGWGAGQQGDVKQGVGVEVQDVAGLHRRGEAVQVLRAETRLVSLDVVVKDGNGKGVHGLRAKDFAVMEDGVPVVVTGFEEHVRPAEVRTAKVKLGPNTFGNAAPGEESSCIVLLLDALDSPVLTDQMNLRKQMIAYMKTVPAGTRIAIVQLDTGLHLLQDFSSDPAELLAAVQGKRNQVKFSTLPTDYRAGASTGGIAAIPGTGMGGRNGVVSTIDPGLSGEAMNAMTRVSASRRNEILRQVVPQLMHYVGTVPGRKSLVWFYAQTAPSAAYDDSFEAMYASDETRFLDAVQETTEELVVSHIALYMVDISGVGQLLSPENGAMDKYAHELGGQAFYSTNDFKGVIAEVADSAWNYYTVSYRPWNKEFDGQFRKLKVEVGRPGVKLEYRAGYFAKSTAAQRDEHETLMKAALTFDTRGGFEGRVIGEAMLFGSAPARDVQFTAHVDGDDGTEKLGKKAPLPSGNFLEGKYRGQKYRNYEVSYTVDPRTLQIVGEANGSYTGGVDVVAVVYDDRGEAVNSVISKASIHADGNMYAALEANGVVIRQTIAVPTKGNYFLRLGVRDRRLDKAGALEVPLEAIKLGGR